MHRNYLGILLQCRFWFSWARGEHQILLFRQVSRQSQCCWSTYQTLSNKALKTVNYKLLAISQAHALLLVSCLCGCCSPIFFLSSLSHLRYPPNNSIMYQKSAWRAPACFLNPLCCHMPLPTQPQPEHWSHYTICLSVLPHPQGTGPSLYLLYLCNHSTNTVPGTGTMDSEWMNEWVCGWMNESLTNSSTGG